MQSERRQAQDPAAKRLAALEIATHLGPAIVDRAELRGWIERHAGAIAPLVQAAHAIVLDHEFLGHVIDRAKLNDEMAAPATAGACGDFVERKRHSDPSVSDGMKSGTSNAGRFQWPRNRSHAKARNWVWAWYLALAESVGDEASLGATVSFVRKSGDN